MPALVNLFSSINEQKDRTSVNISKKVASLCNVSEKEKVCLQTEVHIEKTMLSVFMAEILSRFWSSIGFCRSKVDFACILYIRAICWVIKKGKKLLCEEESCLT